MKVSSLSLGELRRHVARGYFSLRIGPFVVAVSSKLPGIAENLYSLYRDYELLPSDSIADFHIEMKAPNLLRRYYRPQVNFYFDGFTPFKPLPQNQAFALFEWGLNWCVASNAHQFLTIHSAVIAMNGRACILPGSPGSGKSTLCAGMVNRGWRLLSDEMALIDRKTGLITPVPRPVSLKNASIDVIQEYACDAYIGEAVHDTAKGTVAHMRAPSQSVVESEESAVPVLIVFPKYKAGAVTELQSMSKGQACIESADHSFNYHVLGRDGFNMMADLAEGCDAYRLTYQNMDEAIRLLDDLVSG